MGKFKVGDVVIGNEKANTYSITKQGWIGTVIKIPHDNSMYVLGEGTIETGFPVQQSFFDLYNQNQTIEIRQKGQKVIAVLRDVDGKFIKSTKAKCSPEDVFDFEVGRNIALGRLINNPEFIDQERIKAGKISRDTEVKSAVREVHRPAKVGEWIKFTRHDQCASLVGKIGKVLRFIDGCPCVEHEKAFAYSEESRPGYEITIVWSSRKMDYVVLEGYQPCDTPQPFRKAKVGDKIKVLKNIGWHSPRVTIGNIYTVDEIYYDRVGTSTGNTFLDGDGEYIIIGEAKDTIEVGDTVRVIDNKQSYTTYADWFKNKPELVARYAYGHTPDNGIIAEVIAKHPHNTDSDKMLYAIETGNYSPVYLVNGDGIEKVTD